MRTKVMHQEIGNDIEKYKKLITRAIKQVENVPYYLSIQDLYQWGYIGLLEAVNGKVKVKNFESYAYKSIWNRIVIELKAQGLIIAGSQRANLYEAEETNFRP